MTHAIEDLIDLTPEQRKIIDVFEGDQVLRDTFYLTGGTLLKALGIVPRISNDLDFFTFPTIEGRVFVLQIQRIYELLCEAFGMETIMATDRGFIHRPSSTIIDAIADGSKNIDNFVLFGNLQTAGARDSAASKASALCSRDEIKDYIDIAFLTEQNGWLLQDLEGFAEMKFGLGTITEEKLLTELLEKKKSFTIPSHIFLRDAKENCTLVERQIEHLIQHTSL